MTRNAPASSGALRGVPPQRKADAAEAAQEREAEVAALRTALEQVRTELVCSRGRVVERDGAGVGGADCGMHSPSESVSGLGEGVWGAGDGVGWGDDARIIFLGAVAT